MDFAQRRALERVYAAAVRRGTCSPVSLDELAAACDLGETETETAVAQLLDIGLMRSSSGRGVWVLAPDEAIDATVGPMERELRARRRAAEVARRRLTSFIPVFDAAAATSPRSFEILSGAPLIQSVTADLASSAQEEILTARPGGPRTLEFLEEAVHRDEAALDRSVRMRLLYQHTARFDPAIAAYVERLCAKGAQARTKEDGFEQLLVVDRKAALVAVPADPGVAVLIHEPNLVAFLTTVYERLWFGADEFTSDQSDRGKIVGDIQRSIARLLVQGLTDSSIAGRLGMSVRTCRRHIAAIMAELGAQSRFQAGYLLHEQLSGQE